MRSAIPDLLNGDKNMGMTSNDSEKANVLGDFYSSVFVKEPSKPDQHLLCKDVNANTKLQVTFTEATVLEKLEKMNLKKSPGPDMLHPRVLKELSRVISKPLFIKSFKIL